MANASFSINSTVSGLAEQSTGSSQAFVTTFATTKAVGTWAHVTATTVSTNAGTVDVPSSASVIYIKARDSTNGSPFRLSIGTSAPTTVQTIRCSSNKPSLISRSTGTTATWRFFTSAGTTAVTVRVGIY